MQPKKIHPLIKEAREELRQNQITRRDFLRFCTYLGLSLGTANVLAGCAPQAAPEASTEAPPAATPVPEKKGPERGGILKVARQVFRVDHPARFSTAVQEPGPWRHVCEHLTMSDAEGMIQPWLLESWEPSDDLMVWKLNVRKGVKFNNDKDFTADDVVFNFEQWLNVDVGSSMAGILNYLTIEGVKKVDTHVVELNLTEPSISVAYDLYQYPSEIVPAGFGGDLTLEPVGTGPFTMAEFTPGERARLVKRPGYWRNGEDGNPLPYLDELIFVDLGPDRTADLTALQTGEVNTVAEPTIDMWEALKDDDRFVLNATPSASTRVLRVRVDQDPWTDNNVRLALKHCHQRENILASAYRGQGTIGNDSHVSPAHIDYSGEVQPFPFDIQKAKDLLAQAGFPNGLEATLIVNNEERESLNYAQVIKQDAAAAGFNFTINPMPPAQYWEGWDQFNCSITWWAHRPLAHQVLALGYTRDKDGNIVAWNESKWADDEFDQYLREAQSTLDLAERKKIVAKLETIQKERGSICTPFFLNVFSAVDKSVKNLVTQKDEIPNYYDVWLEPV
jgi:peptide/nickel transport system substrate-binding protein